MIVRLLQMLGSRCVMVVIQNENRRVLCGYIFGNSLFAFCATRKTEIINIRIEHTRKSIYIIVGGLCGAPPWVMDEP